LSQRSFAVVLACALLAVYAACWLWQAPGLWRGPLTAAEIDAFLAAAERNLDAPADVKQRLLADLRAFAEADDGRPVHMLNLLRQREALLRWPGGPDFVEAPTPEQANAAYERRAMPLVLGGGALPTLMASVRGPTLLAHDPAVDEVDRVLVVRYPSRRHFLALVSDPAYGPLFPYKYAAVEIALVPTVAAVALPDLRLALAALLAIVWALACALRHAPVRGV
jgi:hypothetical protein